MFVAGGISNSRCVAASTEVRVDQLHTVGDRSAIEIIRHRMELFPLGVVGHVSGHGCSGSIAICIGPSGKEVALTSGIVAKTGCRIIAVDRDLLVGEHLIFFDAIGVDYRVG